MQAGSFKMHDILTLHMLVPVCVTRLNSISMEAYACSACVGSSMVDRHATIRVMLRHTTQPCVGPLAITAAEEVARTAASASAKQPTHFPEEILVCYGPPQHPCLARTSFSTKHAWGFTAISSSLSMLLDMALEDR